MRIARYTDDDLPALARLGADAFDPPWGEDAIAGELSRDVCHALVAKDADATIGYAIFWCVAGELSVVSVAVDPVARRRGVGSALVTEMLRIARDEEACTEGFLDVRVGNEAAIALYARHGFAPHDVRARYYADGEDAVVMRCSLTPPA